MFCISVSDSPRLGSTTDTIAHIIINANDDAFGTLQLSAPAVQVPENYIGPIINVTRTGGIFADVSVKFRAVPITTTAGKRVKRLQCNGKNVQLCTYTLSISKWQEYYSIRKLYMEYACVS